MHRKGFSHRRTDLRSTVSPNTVLSVNSNNKFAVLPIDKTEISTIKFKRLGPEAHRPEKKSEIAAGYDISTAESKTI